MNTVTREKNVKKKIIMPLLNVFFFFFLKLLRVFAVKYKYELSIVKVKAPSFKIHKIQSLLLLSFH